MTHCAVRKDYDKHEVDLLRKTVLLGVSGVLETQRKEEHTLCCH